MNGYVSVTNRRNCRPLSDEVLIIRAISLIVYSAKNEGFYHVRERFKSTNRACLLECKKSIRFSSLLKIVKFDTVISEVAFKIVGFYFVPK